MEKKKKVLIYDGSCRTCQVLKNTADMAVSNFDFVDAHSEVGKTLASQNKLEINASAYILDKGTILAKSDMALEVIGDVPIVGRIFAACLRTIPRTYRDAAYEWLVRHRIT